MTFTLYINTENAAFDPDPTPELARLLRSIAYRLEHESYDTFRTIHDVNGNDVGRYALKAAEPVA